MLSSTQITQITNIFNKMTINNEFEIMFNNYKNDNKLSIIKFMDILKYIKYKSDIEQKELKHNVILDIIYSQEPSISYRISINGIEHINNFLNLVHQRANNILLNILLTQSEFLKNNNFVYIKKIKDINTIVDIDQYDIRFRKSSEIPLNDNDIQNLLNMGINSTSIINFRYKNRLSLDIINNDKYKICIDLTTVQFNTNINNIMNSPKGYEVEIDYSLIKEHKNNTNKILDLMINEMTILKKVIEGNDILLSKDNKKEILDAYKKLVSLNDNINNSLYTMQPISAEVQHVVDKIPNFYSVTDKADGEKAQLFIYNNTVYIILYNLNIKQTKYTSALNNTILEGELIFSLDENNNNRKYIFMAFDCLYYSNIDIRNEILLNKRLDYLYNVCKQLNDNIYICKNFEDKFNLNEQKKFYKNEIYNFYNNLYIQVDKLQINDIYFHPKLFLFPTGGNNSEVYLYAYLIWDFYTNSKMNYKLDGIIFTALEQKYTKNKKEHKYPIYKYKPPITNSIDVYLVFLRNLETNTYLEMYDNSIGSLTNQIYRVGNLFVGDSIGNKEVPILFMKEEKNHEAYFPLINSEVRDQDGNYVQDKTVVEITYNNDPSIPHQYRWSILRTRWDKTEDVYKYQRRYGNYKDVAIKTWKSIKEAVTIEEINNLSNPVTYKQQQKLLQQRINTTVITSDRQQDIYYQKITNLCKKMREFHNWIKSIIIYTYCSPFIKYNNTIEQRTSILDIGCGRGGDILKWYHARVGEYVGIDVDYYGIYSVTDSAISRYNQYKKKFPNFGKIYWLQADGSAILQSKYQENKLTNMSIENKKLIDKIFSKNKKFDCISSMFSLHYLFDCENSTGNLVHNINKFLNIGGFFICTLFDGHTIMEKFNNTNTFTTYYTNEEGIRQKSFEIIKKFEGNLEDKEGFPIDVHLSWFMEENKYVTEYLITPPLLNKIMNNAGCRLVETDLFSNLYYLNQQYFTSVIEYEENPQNYQFYKKIATFYEDLKGSDKESKTFSFLHRYYVYQKFK